MFIKYSPKSQRAQESTRPAPTNLGEFLPGQVCGPYRSEQHQREARRLVANGDFIEVDRAGAPMVAKKAGAVIRDMEFKQTEQTVSEPTSTVTTAPAAPVTKPKAPSAPKAAKTAKASKAAKK